MNILKLWKSTVDGVLIIGYIYIILKINAHCFSIKRTLKSLNRVSINKIQNIMKKIMATAAFASLILVACNKKNVEPAEPIVATSETQEFKYNKNIRVYDDTKTYYMDLTLSSNNKADFEVNAKGLTNSKMVLINEVPENIHSSSAKRAPQSAGKPIDLNSVKMDNLLKINKIFKGTNKAVKLVSDKSIVKNETQKTDYLVSGGPGSLWVDIGLCNYYRVYAYSKTLLGDDYSYDMYGLHYIQSKYIVANAGYVDFSGTGALYRKINLTCVTSGYYSADILVY